MIEKIINLKKYKKDDARIFTNRDVGVQAREECQLDKLDDILECNINVLLPLDTWGINPSFFGGLFESSLKRFDRETFCSRYRFVYSNETPINESLQRDIDDDIDYVLRVISAEDNHN